MRCLMRLFGRFCVLILVAACASVVEEPAVTTTALPPTTTALVATTTTAALAQTTATQRIVEPVLVAHYPLDGTGDNVADRSGALDGVVFGAVPAADRFGDPDSALFFDGDDDYVEVSLGDSPDINLNTQAITIAAWVLINREPRDMVFWWDAVSFGPDNHVLGVHGQGGVVAGIQNSWNCAYTTRENVMGREWHHIAVTRDAAGTTRVYQDGIQMELVPQSYPQQEPQLSLTCDEEAQASALMWIGSDLEAWEFFEGAIDDVRIYDGALTPEEVLSLYEMNSGR